MKTPVHLFFSQLSRLTSKFFFEMVGTPMLMWSFTLIYLHLKWGQFEGKVPQSVIFSLIILYTPDFPDLCTSQNPQNPPKPFPPSGEMKSSSGPPSAFTRSGVRTSIKSRPPKRQPCEISKTIKHHPFHEICFRFSILNIASMETLHCPIFRLISSDALKLLY